jgi:hypothetical protein
MSIPGFKNSLNWKYILREILLIFIGINLAIWFNDWNSSKKITHNKKIAISKIVEEIKNNTAELNVAHKSNQLILSAFSAYKEIYDNNTSEIISTPLELGKLRMKYPGYFRVTDSIEYENGLYHYKGVTHIELEIPILTDIAWETTRAINVTNEFDYECLYNLESIYNLQSRVQSEIDKAANAVQKNELEDLMSILGFLNQLDLQLQENYKNILINIESCL